jgi:hypothetical protein
LKEVNMERIVRSIRQGPGFRAVDSREQGNVLILSFMLVGLIAAFAMAHGMAVQKNMRQSRYFNDLSELRLYAQSGINLAVQQLNGPEKYGDGNFGTTLWTPASDVGRDGKAGTGDEGENDGIPTPGEPNLTPAAIGPTASGIGLLVHSFDSEWPDVKRVVSTAFLGSTSSTLEVYVKVEVLTLPQVSTVYVQPGAGLDLAGTSFTINGNDTNINGTPGSEPAVYGIATSIGTPAGSNVAALLNQVPPKQETYVIGKGGTSSFGEAGGVDFDVLFNAFKASHPKVVSAGSYSNKDLGSDALKDYQINYCPGNLTLSGSSHGAGVLFVDGSLTLSGGFNYAGLILVRGDVNFKGGSGNINMYGTMMIGKTLTAIDPISDFGLNGNVKMYYSSAALKNAISFLDRQASVLYWNRML